MTNELRCTVHQLAGKRRAPAPFIYAGISMCQRCLQAIGALVFGDGTPLEEVLEEVVVEGRLP